MYDCQLEIQKIKLYEHSLEINISNQKIKSVSLGYNFLIILTKSGLLYSMGTSNNYGQLGLGHTNSIYFPTLIEILKNDKIVSVQCGESFVVCKNNKNQIYTWG